METLLRLQASANIADGKGCFPLHLAAWRGNAEICQVLLTQGPSRAKVNEQVCTALCYIFSMRTVRQLRAES